MAEFCVDNLPSYPVSGALGQYILVRLNAGQLAACGAADADAIGWTARQTFAAGERVSVIPINAQGKVIAVAAGVIAVGNVINQAAAGQLQTGAGTVRRGIALSAAGAAGDWFELLPD